MKRCGGCCNIALPPDTYREKKVKPFTMLTDHLTVARNEMPAKGFLDIELDPMLDLFQEIERLKKEKNAVVLAH